METTRAEKFLAFVLAVFLLIGGLWAYFQPLDRTDFTQRFREPGTAADRAAVRRHDVAQARLERARGAVASRREGLGVAREAYRTALEDGSPAAGLRSRYERAQTALAAAETGVRSARERVTATTAAADAAASRIERDARDQERRAEDRRHSRDRETFALRFGWVLLCLAGAFWLFNRQRRSHSRYLPAGMAAVGAATAQALVLATDYTTDYIDVSEIGPLVLSIAGVALSVAAFAGLQRYLARRVPQRRVRRRECPFCGFPAGSNSHCEGCGREVVAACTHCDEPRRVGAQFCGACGHA